MEANKYIFDTSAINHVIERELAGVIMKKSVEIYISYIQKDKLDAMKEKYSTKHDDVHKFLNSIQAIESPVGVFALDCTDGVIKIFFGSIFLCLPNIRLDCFICDIHITNS